MQYYGYDVESKFLDSTKGCIKWVTTGNGEYIIGSKGGKKYFIKRNIHIRYPDKSLPKSVYDIYYKDALRVEKKQKKLKRLLSTLSTHKDRIVIEDEHFWDSDNMFVTVTESIPGCLPGEQDFSRVPAEVFVRLSLDFAERLRLLHGCDVIHGDLKEKNVLVKKSGSEYITYLIDFDTSYCEGEIPAFDSIGGTDGYQSPEVLLYGSDEGAAEPSTITPAVDIFSAALVIHKWWTGGTYPNVDFDECGSVGGAVYLGKPVEIDKKFDTQIGPNQGATLMSLLNWMLTKEPSARPTAEQVVSVLKDESAVPEEFHKGSDMKPFDTTPWRAHSLLISILGIDELKALGVKSFKKVSEGGGVKGYKYRVALKDGSEKNLTCDELVAAGYASKLDAILEEPWPEHEIEFESPSVIASKGYVRIRKAEQGFRKRYLITMEYGLEIDKGHEWLISQGLAHYKVRDDIVADTPWPEHGTEYVKINMTRLHIISVSRVEIAGEHRYKLVYDVMIDGKQKVNDKVSANNMKLMGLIK